MTSPDLHELPFTPVHAPIMATAPGMHSGMSLSRSAYAKLATVGFPEIKDRKGESPDMVDPADHINFIAAKEEADRLQANEIYLQFLAFSRYYISISCLYGRAKRVFHVNILRVC